MFRARESVEKAGCGWREQMAFFNVQYIPTWLEAVVAPT
jgi:hypothetical protein